MMGNRISKFLERYDFVPCEDGLDVNMMYRLYLAENPDYDDEDRYLVSSKAEGFRRCLSFMYDNGVDIPLLMPRIMVGKYIGISYLSMIDFQIPPATWVDVDKLILKFKADWEAEKLKERSGSGGIGIRRRSTVYPTNGIANKKCLREIESVASK